MKHLLRILEIQHLRDNKVIWEAKDLLNTLHIDGEKFMLSALFKTTAGIAVPSFYYLGMDNRSSVEKTNNMSSITTEPTGNGYSRQPVSSATGFTIEGYSSGGLDHWRAKSQVVSFSASGGQWGPVSNVFLTDRLDDTGYLIATAPLPGSRSLAAGEIITFRFALNLVDQT
jgi:hypothetical protein